MPTLLTFVAFPLAFGVPATSFMSHLLAPAVTLLTVYRPGSEQVTVKFFEEFATVLEGLITRNSQLIIVGDFNIHVEDHMDSHSIQFSALLKQFGLHQHVREPTFVRGGTLDLVITSDISTESPHTSAGNISPLTCGVYSSSPSRSASTCHPCSEGVEIAGLSGVQ